MRIQSTNKMFTRAVILLALLAAPFSQSVQAEILCQAWDEALNVDHSLKAVQQNTAAAAVQFDMTKSARKPGVSLQAGYTILDNAPATKTDFGALTAGEDQSLSFKAVATLPLYTSGKIRIGIKAADAAFQAFRTLETGEIQS